MCEPVTIPWTPSPERENATRRAEFGRLVVTDASKHCPAPELCEPQGERQDPDLGITLPPETYEHYVRRHCVDHEIYIDAPFEDLQRNLFIWCFYGFHKYALENESLSPWPHWEDHEFLANDDFNESDLEMDQPNKRLRTYRLPSLAARQQGETRRQKKLEKPRETEKTAEGFAFATWILLRQAYIHDNVNYRITVHSSTTRLTRKRYINHAFTVWGRRSGKLFESFHGWEDYGPEPQLRPGNGRLSVRPGDDVVRIEGERLRPQARRDDVLEVGGHRGIIAEAIDSHTVKLREPWSGPIVEGELDWLLTRQRPRRKIGLIRSRGALNKIDNQIRTRWLQDAEKSFAPHSMMGIGADSESTGERADHYIGDDVQTADNSRTVEMRMAIGKKVAEQSRQLEHGGAWLWICTRKYNDDIAGEIDREHREFYWILHRKASWVCRDCGEEIYYWPVDGTGKPRITEAWLAEQKKKFGTRNFWNELYNEPLDPEQQIFKPEWFEIVPLDRNVPLEIRAGLGAITSDEDLLRYEEELALLEQEGVRIHSICCGDPAGLEKRSKRGDATAIVGLRLDREMRPWFVVVTSGQWSSEQQKENAFAACLYAKPSVFVWEIVQDSGVEKAWSDFQLEKSRSLGSPVLMPMRFIKPKRTQTKMQKIEELEPYLRGGVKLVVSSMCTVDQAKLLIAQLCGLGVEDHDDLADATANALDYFKRLPLPQSEAPAEESMWGESENGNPTVSLAGIIAKRMANKRAQSWARSGGVR